MTTLSAFLIGAAFTACFLLTIALSRRDVDEEAGVHIGRLDGKRCCPHCKGVIK